MPSYYEVLRWKKVGNKKVLQIRTNSRIVVDEVTPWYKPNKRKVVHEYTNVRIVTDG